MRETKEFIPSADSTGRESSHIQGISERTITGIALGAVSIAAFELQRRGITNRLPETMESASESLSHPVLGYVGASVGIWASKRWLGNKLDNLSAWTMAGGANFATEYLQSIIHSSPEAQDFLSAANRNETAKDWCFAMFGAGLFIVQSAKSRRC